MSKETTRSNEELLDGLLEFVANGNWSIQRHPTARKLRKEVLDRMSEREETGGQPTFGGFPLIRRTGPAAVSTQAGRHKFGEGEDDGP